MTLRWDWWKRWEALQRPPYPPVVLWKITQAVEVGAWLIDEWGAELERAGWQPVHVLGPPQLGKTAGGLAWRWPGIPVIRRVDRRYVVARTRWKDGERFVSDWDANALWMVYRAERDGTVTRLMGPDRKKVLDDFDLPWMPCDATVVSQKKTERGGPSLLA